MGDTLVDHYLRAWVSFLNWINVVLWTISCVVHIFLTLIWTSENSMVPLYGNSNWYLGAIDFGTPTPLEGIWHTATERVVYTRCLLSLTFHSSFTVRVFPLPSLHQKWCGYDLQCFPTDPIKQTLLRHLSSSHWYKHLLITLSILFFVSPMLLVDFTPEN